MAFKSRYWPSLFKSFTKDLSTHLVSAEIIGVIKGSESPKESLQPLSRAEYLGRSSRLAPTLEMQAQRSQVSDMYERYARLKDQRDDYDYFDRVVRLLRILRKDQSLIQVLRRVFDEVYIDKVQDQRLIDIEVFIIIIRDRRGFHFAEDTAQAISQDSTFRFNDVKKILFNHFSPAIKSTK